MGHNGWRWWSRNDGQAKCVQSLNQVQFDLQTCLDKYLINLCSLKDTLYRWEWQIWRSVRRSIHVVLRWFCQNTTSNILVSTSTAEVEHLYQLQFWIWEGSGVCYRAWTMCNLEEAQVGSLSTQERDHMENPTYSPHSADLCGATTNEIIGTYSHNRTCRNVMTHRE
jgi:hypothetical protein